MRCSPNITLHDSILILITLPLSYYQGCIETGNRSAFSNTLFAQEIPGVNKKVEKSNYLFSLLKAHNRPFSGAKEGLK